MPQQGSRLVLRAATVDDDAGRVGAEVLDVEGSTAWVEFGQGRVADESGLGLPKGGRGPQRETRCCVAGVDEVRLHHGIGGIGGNRRSRADEVRERL